MKIEKDHIPLRRPHFHLRGNQLFFMISQRPHLDLQSDEVELWNRIDGKTTASELQLKSANACEVLEKLWQQSLIELAPSSFGRDRKRVLVIEPHMDDAILSVGGLMWQLRNSHEFTVVSVAGHSNFTSYYRIDREYFDIETVSALRKQESELVMRLLGGKHLTLGRLDAPLRYQGGNWTLDWYRKNRRSISAFINHSPTSEEVRSCASEIGNILAVTDASEIWIPMGVGTSADHEMTRNACLLALMDLKDRLDQVVVYLYQDVPYAMEYPLHSEQITTALGAAGASTEVIPVDITESMSPKLRLISIYASQFKMSYMGPRVEKTARVAARANDKFGEILVRVDRLPRALDQFDFYSGRDHVRELAASLSGWLKRNRRARRITILCPMGVGRWKDYVEFILRKFPDSTVDFHLTEDGMDETERFSSPRIRIHPVEARGSAWILRILKVVFSGSRPLIVFTGLKFNHMARSIRTACVISDPLSAVSMGHLAQALALHGSGSPGRLPADLDQ